ncbi:hypothetical protein [Cupriavidus sp. SS-3]|uniref:hypothetical protein n=1 Tax=Cupriavidus sp. SS-3 TaxID=3109596 RepID=UPI002DB628BC|nr:hypothetical protein [Cupriavidus sp. SS-3]MEC3769054.1 hypothetical protein [Cupriavidus sp. SS-3]
MTAHTPNHPRFIPIYGPGPCLRTERLGMFRTDGNLRRFLAPDMEKLLESRLVLRDPSNGWRLITSQPDALVQFIHARAHDKRILTDAVRALRKSVAA